jgi:hypothetical protein
VVVKNAEAGGCISNSQPTLTGLEFRGRFFNTESSPTSQLGEVEVGIGALRTSIDAGSAMEVDSHYERCSDDFCSTPTTLGFGVLGFVQPGTTNTFHIKWDKPNHRFVFQLNNGPRVASPHTVLDSSAPFSPFKAIDLAAGRPRLHDLASAIRVCRRSFQRRSRESLASPETDLGGRRPGLNKGPLARAQARSQDCFTVRCARRA